MKLQIAVLIGSYSGYIVELAGGFFVADGKTGNQIGFTNW